MRGERTHRRLAAGRRGRGVSLVEVVLALVVVVIGLFGLLDLMTASRRHSVRAERRAVAYELAAGKLAEFQAAGYEAVARLAPNPADTSTSPSVHPPALAAFEAPYTSENYRWQARLFRAGADALNVEVRVYWDPTPAASRTAIEEHSVSLGGLLIAGGGAR